MSDTCQLCYTPNTVTRTSSPLLAGGAITVCVEADACWDRERVARAIRVEEYEEQDRLEWARELAYQEEQDAQDAAYLTAVRLLY